MITLKHSRKRLLTNKKAVSVVIMTMFFVSATFAIGILFYEWSQGAWGKSVAGADAWTQRRISSMNEGFVIESVGLDKSAVAPNPNCSITVRNIGSTPLTVSSVYVDGILATTPNSNIAVNSYAVFKISVSIYIPHTIKIVTSNGTSAIVVWAPT